MRILICNDDGIYSPGIRALAELASEFGDVRIVAPAVEQSSMSLAITSSRPLTYRSTKIGHFDAFRVDGTPADCVSLGAYHWDRVDLVFSGINLGLNLGSAMWHSGTLAAAKQAALLGIRGVAFSAPAPDEDGVDYEKLMPYGRRVVRLILEDRDLALVNVNFPTDPEDVVWTRQSVRHYDGRVVEGTDPQGRTLFWFTAAPVEATEEGTDRWAVERSLVSMTPLRLDLTDPQALARVRAGASR